MADEMFTSGAGHDCAAHVEEARRRLAAVLVGASDDDLDTVLVGYALSVLNDTVPPLPPLRYPDEGVAAVDGIPRALAALAKAGAAAAAAASVADAARFARAADILTTHPAVAE